MDLREIKLAINERIKKENERAKEEAFYYYRLSDLVGLSIGRMFDKKNKFPDIEDAFPSIFDENYLQDKKARDLKNNLIRFAEAHNEHRHAIENQKQNEMIMLDLLEERYNEGLPLTKQELDFRISLRKRLGLSTIDVEDIEEVKDT